jgi:protein TonB
VSALWSGVGAHLWQATLVLALIALLATALRRAPARYLEVLWTVGLLKLLVPLPLAAAAWPGLRRLTAGAEQQDALGPAVQTLSQIAYPEMLWTPPMGTGGGGLVPQLAAAAAVVWALGTAVLLVSWWLRGRLALPAGEAPWHAPDDIVERIARVAQHANVPLNRIRITDADVVPCVGNLRRPVVVLSCAVVRTLRDDELRAVLLHEDAHRRRGDLWRNAAQRLSTCVFFFYPPAWWLARRLRASAEMACDEAVLAAGIDARTYARALARTVVLELAPSPAPALASGRSHLSTRLQRIQNAERYAAMKHHRLAIFAALAVAVGSAFIPVEQGVGLPVPSPIRAAEELAVEQRQGEWLPAAELRDLNGLDVFVALPGRSLRVAEVLEEIAYRAGFEVYVTGNEDLTRRVTIEAPSEIRVRNALEILEGQAGLEYRVVDRATLIVRVRAATSTEKERELLLVRAQRELEAVEETVEQTLRQALQRNREVPVRMTGQLRVRALGADGAPLPGVMVVVRGPAGARTEYTGIDGTARFPGLTPGAYTATFSLSGFETVVREGLEIRSQRTTQVSMQLGRSGVRSSAAPTAARARAPAGTAAGPYRVGGDIREPERIHYVQPEYPELARRARLEGFVILQAAIDQRGNVRDAEVLRGLGLGLDDAAREAVMQWRYTPTYYNGRPVEVILTINVVFQLIQ